MAKNIEQGSGCYNCMADVVAKAMRDGTLVIAYRDMVVVSVTADEDCVITPYFSVDNCEVCNDIAAEAAIDAQQA